MKTRGIIIFVLFLLVIPLVFGFAGFGDNFTVRKTHLGAQGLTGGSEQFSSRFTLDYNQPGYPNANSTFVGGINVGWFDKNTTVPPFIKTEGGIGGGSSGGRVPACFDGLDNDNDGLVDMRDPDCESVSDNNEYGPLGFAFECVPNFICTSWSECRDGEQSRICSDINACEEERTETRDCVVPVREMPAAAVIADEKKIEVKAEKPDEKKISVLGVAGYVSYLWIALVSLVVIFAAVGVYTRAKMPKTEFTRRVREYDEGYDDSYKRLQELNRKIEKLRK